MTRTITAILILAASSLTWGQSYLCRMDVQTQLASLRQLSGTGTHTERAIVVDDDGTFLSFQGERDRAPFETDEHSVAVIHNHPWEDVRPSDHDMEVSKRIGLPVYVVTRTALWVGTPDGKRYQADTFKTLNLYTADPEGPPLFGREHPFTVTDVLSQCVASHISPTVFLRSAN